MGIYGERTDNRRGAPLSPAWAAGLVTSAIMLTSAPAAAGPGDTQGGKGVVFAKRRDCVKAVPLLEEAEKLRHRPLYAVALADCYVATGELIRASDLYHRVVNEKPQRFWVRYDYNARKSAIKKAADVEARIPTVSFSTAAPYDELQIEVDGASVGEGDEKKVAPDVAINIVARAKDRKELRDKVTLNEGERRKIVLRLAPLVEKPLAKKKKSSGAAGSSPTSWLGARYYGAVIPKFVMNLFANGGRTLPIPGGAFTFTTQASEAEITVALGYLSYRMGDTAIKPRGEPDTEWELMSSNLQALTATIDLMWSFPLDSDRDVFFRIGGAAGFGYMFVGNLSRVQSYPKDPQNPGDPSTWSKCVGPNNPMGSFRYCNALDKDAAHYPGYSEPDWFHHGIRPLVFPWLVLPQIGLSFRPARNVAIDIDTGLSISGFLTTAGFRVGL